MVPHPSGVCMALPCFATFDALGAARRRYIHFVPPGDFEKERALAVETVRHAIVREPMSWEF